MKLLDYFKKNEMRKLLLVLTAVAGAGVIFLILSNIVSIVGFAADFVCWVLRVMSGFTGGLIIAYLLLGIVERLSGLFRKLPPLANKEKASRGLAIATTYILILFLILSIFSALVVAITRQVSEINFSDLPRLIQELQIQVVGLMNSILEVLEKMGIATEGMKEYINHICSSITGSLANVGSGFFSFANNMASLFSTLLFAVIFSIYFLYDTEGLMRYWSNAFLALLGKKIHGNVAVLLNDADKCFSGYIRGQFADAVFMAIAVCIILAVIGVPYAVVIGILSGIGNLIPYVGPIVAYGLTIGVCIASGQWNILLVALIAICILQTIDGNVINPRLLSTSIDVHPVLVIVALLFGSAIGGFEGMLLAVPVASFFKIQFEKVVAWRDKCASN